MNCLQQNVAAEFDLQYLAKTYSRESMLAVSLRRRGIDSSHCLEWEITVYSGGAHFKNFKGLSLAYIVLTTVERF